MNSDDTDAAVRSLRLVSDAQRALASDTAWKRAVLEGTPMSDTRNRRSALRSRPVVIAAGVAALALTVGAASTAATLVRADAPRIECWTGDDRYESVAVTSTDPVAICVSHWEDTRGEPAPPMAVYTDAQGVMSVRPTSAGGGADVTAIEDPVVLDPRPARLQAALDDHLDGLPSQCLDGAAAAEAVRADLDRLALVGWTVSQGPGEPADGRTTCAAAFIPEDGEERVVLLQAQDSLSHRIPWEMTEDELYAFYLDSYSAPPPAGSKQVGEAPPPEELARRTTDNIRRIREDVTVLRDAVDGGGCLSAQEAEDLVRATVDPTWNPVIDAGVIEELPCAVVEMGLGGTWIVHIVGPAIVD